MAVLMCMVTNLSLPLRNVMVKQRTVLRQSQLAVLGKAGPNSVRLALDTAVDLNFGGMLILTPLCLVFMSSLEVPAEDASIALRLGMHRIVYEIASLMVLTRIDAVMHGSLDVLKRAAMTRECSWVWVRCAGHMCRACARMAAWRQSCFCRQLPALSAPVSHPVPADLERARAYNTSHVCLASAVIALASFESVRPFNLAGSLLAFGTLLWYKLSLSRQASASASGLAFYLPERWRGRVARLLKLALCCVTTFALRLFIQAHMQRPSPIA